MSDTHRSPKQAERQAAEEMCQLANARSRLRHALSFTWTQIGVTIEEQCSMLEKILDGNRMEEFELQFLSHDKGQTNDNQETLIL
jgi:hypothetical protein